MNWGNLANKFFWGVWPEDFLPTIGPDQYTLRISANRSAMLWPRFVNWRAMKEARKFAAIKGYSDARIVSCDRNRLLGRFDYTFEFVR